MCWTEGFDLTVQYIIDMRYKKKLAQAIEDKQASTHGRPRARRLIASENKTPLELEIGPVVQIASSEPPFFAVQIPSSKVTTRKTKKKKRKEKEKESFSPTFHQPIIHSLHAGPMFNA